MTDNKTPVQEKPEASVSEKPTPKTATVKKPAKPKKPVVPKKTESPPKKADVPPKAAPAAKKPPDWLWAESVLALFPADPTPHQNSYR